MRNDGNLHEKFETKPEPTQKNHEKTTVATF